MDFDFQTRNKIGNREGQLITQSPWQNIVSLGSSGVKIFPLLAKLLSLGSKLFRDYTAISNKAKHKSVPSLKQL
jgi:hypothetical protein